MYDKLLRPGENALEEVMLLQKMGQQTSVLHPLPQPDHSQLIPRLKSGASS